jgi:pyruvate,orthophosphate dikinase
VGHGHQCGGDGVRQHGETSGTGVAFTRDPASGDKNFFGECLMNAQGEDVVAGIRTPLPVNALAKNVPEAYKELEHTYKKLEKHYRDMLDLEFTIQEGKLYMLQTRVGKRTGISAVKIAVDMVREGLISKQEAVQRIGPEQLAQYLYPIFDTNEESKSNPLGKGLPAGPGAAAGKIALTPDRAVTMKAAGTRVVLVRQETSPDDIHGMNAASGFLTARGGMTSHAAVVARQMGKVCVAGCDAVVLDGQSVRIRPKCSARGTIFRSTVRPAMCMRGTCPSSNLKSFRSSKAS